jgi:uncharacterized circularly permuted ATP-grasp superfamily protein
VFDKTWATGRRLSVLSFHVSNRQLYGDPAIVVGVLAPDNAERFYLECRTFLAWRRGVKLVAGQEVAARDGKLKNGLD